MFENFFFPAILRIYNNKYRSRVFVCLPILLKRSYLYIECIYIYDAGVVPRPPRVSVSLRLTKRKKTNKQKKTVFLPAPPPAPKKHTGQDPEAAAHEANCGLKQTHTDTQTSGEISFHTHSH